MLDVKNSKFTTYPRTAENRKRVTIAKEFSDTQIIIVKLNVSNVFSYSRDIVNAYRKCDYLKVKL